jgi:hypothetical protein
LTRKIPAASFASSNTELTTGQMFTTKNPQEIEQELQAGRDLIASLQIKSEPPASPIQPSKVWKQAAATRRKLRDSSM